MSSLWQRIKNGLSLQRAASHTSEARIGEPSVASVRPNDGLSEATSDGCSNGYAVSAGVCPESPRIFDPALKHHSRAFRLGDPEFSDPDVARAWRAIRADVMHHVLSIAMEPPWESHLVLRGSFLLTAWLGSEARQPGDLDFVFRPQTAAMGDPSSRALLADLVTTVSDRARSAGVWIDATNVAIDDIWTYERAPGRRIAFPWKTEDSLSGVVQVDIVFGEQLWEEPVLVSIPHPSGGDTRTWAASPALSLAWKLLWLETDSYPQGKDLYDATLLAERVSLRRDLLRHVLRANEPQGTKLKPDFPMRWNVDWANFRRECPWVEGEARDWQEKLTRSLAPVFLQPELD